jgi:hypothetical protein
MLLWLFLILTSWPAFAAARKDPTPGNLRTRNLTGAFLVFALLVSGGYALGKDMAQRDSRNHAACKP